MHTTARTAGERTSHTSIVPAASVYTHPHRLHFFSDMGPMLHSVARDARHARERIWLETYIFRSDRLARAAASTLAKAVRRGADVRLLYDPLGCQATDPSIFAWLSQRGVQVRAYRDRSVSLKTGSWFPRDHARILVIDDAAYTGGAAWGDEWLPRSLGGMGWHDVCSRVEGPCVEDFAHAFEGHWAEALGDIVDPASYATGTRHRDLEFVADAPRANRIVFERHIERIHSARERIWIANAYFFPPAAMLHALAAARRRGVDVRVILTEETDLPIIRHAAHAEMDEWLHAGLLFFGYERAQLHAKYAVIDDDWCTVGTFNANPFSLYFSTEVNLFVYEPRAVRRVASIFEHDLAGAAPITHSSRMKRTVGDQIRDRFAQAILAGVEANAAAGQK